MDFTLTDEQRMTTESVRNLLAAECTMPQLRKMLAEGEVRDERRWAKLFGLGLGGMLASEDLGGLGLHSLDFALVAQECGRALLPEPLVEQAGIAVLLLVGALSLMPDPSEGWSRGSGRLGYDEAGVTDLLSGIIAGSTAIAIGHVANPFVIGADTADFLLLPAGDEIHLVSRADVELTAQPGIDPFRRLFRVDWRPGRATRLVESPGGRVFWPAAFERGALFAAAQCLGIAERAVEIAVAYANDRQQFGKPIGSYQAIKHALATVQIKIEFARPVVHAAAEQLYGDDLLSATRVSHAKLAAGDAADLACRTAIQVHGAMGYSWETDVHFYLKRALALAGAWGDRSFHRRRVAHRLFETGLPIGPDQTFTRKGAHHAA